MSDLYISARKLLKKTTQDLFAFFGLELIKKQNEKHIDEEFGEIYNICKNYTMTSKERMYSLYKAVEYIVKAEIPGDLVECGVWKGGSSMLIAMTLLKFGDKTRKIYLYDTFEGMVEPTEEDNSLYRGEEVLSFWKKSNKTSHNEWCFASFDEVKKNMRTTHYPLSNTVFIKGKVEDTIPKNIPNKISLLRLDTDWYESTRHELEHLYPRVSEKGVMIIDDYGFWPGARKAVDEYLSKHTPILLNRIDYTGRIGIKSD